MAYDWYITICNPLLYTLIMCQRACVQLVIGPYAMGLLSAIIHEIFTFRLPFCGPNVVNHFFCDILPVLSLACADTQNNKFVLFIMAGLIGIFSALIILVSYIFILKTILNIQSADGRRKAFSTCLHTCLLWPSCLGHFSSFIYSPIQVHLRTLIKWFLHSMLHGFPC